jgi:proline iminopeptidase
MSLVPDAEAGHAASRADPFAPLTSEWLRVSGSHEIYVESVGRRGGAPAVYLHGGPGSGCQADHRRLFDPERFHAVLFDQRGAGRSKPKGSRDHNTLPDLIADMEAIRDKFGFARWIVAGGSWGATLALAYAQAHPDRVAGLALRATFLGTGAEVETAFGPTLARFYPHLHRDFLELLPEEERGAAVQSYWRRILDPDPAVHGPAARAWHDTERALSEVKPGRVRLDRLAVRAGSAMPATPFMEAHYFRNDSFMSPDQLLRDAPKLAGIPGIIVQGRYDLLCPPSTSAALTEIWREAEIRVVEAAGHNLYDPGIRDAVMKSIADLAARTNSLQDIPQTA